MDEFVEQFLVESRELVEQAGADLLALEENPGDTGRLDGAFRAFHTLKGSAAIVDFSVMVGATHKVEDLLARVRNGEVSVSRSLVTDCLAFLNILSGWLDAMAVEGAIPPDAQAQAEVFLKAFGQHGAASASPKAEMSKPEGVPRALLMAQLELLKGAAERSSGLVLSAGTVASNVLSVVGRNEEAANLRQSAGEAAASNDTQQLIRDIQAALGGGADGGVRDSSAKVLRVDVARVDDIVRLTGELTIAKNAVGYAASLARDESDPKAVATMLRDQHGVLDRLIGELQRAALSIRVLPLRFVFQRFPRLIRDTAAELGKAVKIEIFGDETEADKVIVENLFEPLLHTLRNALDHGVESAEERAASGKASIAVLRLSAARSGDQVIVEVSDDGRGIDLDIIRQVALERGVLGSDEIGDLDENGVLNLIFAPGFSTAKSVTDISGRGVGMNAVRTAIEKLGGSVQVASRKGRGTTVRLKLPFSILMTRVMTVSVGGQTFGIPFDSIIETARVPREAISEVGAAYAFVLRDRTVPVIDLGASMGSGFTSAGGPEANLVVVSLEGTLGSVEVDALGEPMDVMLRPPEGLLASVPGIAGTSLLGDGSVLIVLDLEELLI